MLKVKDSHLILLDLLAVTFDSYHKTKNTPHAIISKLKINQTIRT